MTLITRQRDTYAIARSSFGAYSQVAVSILGKNIERLRLAGGHENAAAFARAIGITSATLNDWESGRYTNLRLDSLLRIARGVPCTVDDLLIGVDAAYDAVSRRGLSDSVNKSESVTSSGMTDLKRPSISKTCADASRKPQAISTISLSSRRSKVPSPTSAASLTLSALLLLLPQLAAQKPTMLEALRVIVEEELAQEDGDEAAPHDADSAPESRPTWGWHGHKRRL